MGVCGLVFFFQAENGIRDFCLSRGLGDVCKRQVPMGVRVVTLHPALEVNLPLIHI